MAAMELGNDRISIKQLLFTKAIPNHVIPIDTNGYKIYACVDCGDKFLFQSSYEHHINRKSLEINYTCRFCSTSHTFYNRCNLLAHIRNHAFKTTTINMSDLKIHALPLEFFKINETTEIAGPANVSDPVNSDNNDTNSLKQSEDSNCCSECQEQIGSNHFRNRAKHFMRLSGKVYTCPLCLFVLPTLCAFKAHIRIHVRSPPYVCPECGITLRAKALYYPYNHDCEGFKMMRVNARLKCPLPNCYLYHPSEHKQHMESCHIKKVFKCSSCVVASFSEPVMERHVATHGPNSQSQPLVFYQCEMCPGRLVMEYQYKNHVKGHLTNQVFPCRSCSSIFKEIPTLVQHYVSKHATKQMSELLLSVLNVSEEMYYVIKRCEKCKRSFRYKCKFSDINGLPTDCPYNCLKSNENIELESDSTITCHLCKKSISCNWSKIKMHYAANHKSIRCLDLELKLTRCNIVASKTKQKRLRNNQARKGQTDQTVNSNIVESIEVTEKHICKICKEEYDEKDALKEHLIVHRDPYMAYQCMECGKCFVVKPSFSTHLLLEHEISNPEAYIEEKKCYNKNALIKNDFNPATVKEPVRENQCNICMDQFDNSDDLEKHYRVHGMAFLIKNKSKSP